MSNLDNRQIIAPPIEEEVFPYRRVWRSLSIQILAMAVITTTITLIDTFVGIDLEGTLNFGIALAVSVIPVGLWLIFSVVAERFVIQPRNNLLSLAVATGLCASAIGIPLVNDFFQLNQWIPLQSAFQRILGYTFTVGVLDTAIKLVVLRVIVVPQSVRVRTDTIAFCVACAIGYTFVLNLNLIATIRPTISIAMIYVFGTYVMQLTSSLVLAYGISQVVFDNAYPILLPFIVLTSAFIIGVISPLESGLVSGGLTIDGGFARPIFSVGFLIVVLIFIPSVIFFLYNVAERREEEKYSSNGI